MSAARFEIARRSHDLAGRRSGNRKQGQRYMPRFPQLHAMHQQQADADGHERHDDQAEQGRQDALP